MINHPLPNREKTLPMGFCLQCSRTLFTNYIPSQHAFDDFAYLPPDRRKVHCYGCCMYSGPIEVDAAGYCVSHCELGHGPSLLERVWTALKKVLGVE